MDLVNDVRDTHTYDYYVTVYCKQSHHHAHFSLEPNPQTGECVLDVTSWDAKERAILHYYLQQHRIRYDLDRVLQDCDD